MPQSLFFQMLSSSGHKYKYGLELIYQDKCFAPTMLSIFFCTVKYKKKEGVGFVVDSQHTYSYNFNNKTGNLIYASLHRGDFSKKEFRWGAESRLSEFEHDKIEAQHFTQAVKTAKFVYNHLMEEKRKVGDKDWQKKHQPFLSPLEMIIQKEK